MNDMTILQLVYRLNEIRKEFNSLEIRSMELEDEYNAIVCELCGRMPQLEGDPNLEPLIRVRKKGDKHDRGS